MSVRTAHDDIGPAARFAAGRSARARASRESQAGVPAGDDRPDPVDVLVGQSETRLPELVPIRYGRMLVSPFAYFRGAAAVMASDLARTPDSGLTCQLCGDAHLCNFGVFASPERRLVFDVNDFDETHPGPWEWDVKRLAASLAVAGRDNGFRRKVRAAVVLAAVGRYRRAMRRFAGQGNAEVWYARADVEEVDVLLKEQVGAAQRRRFAAAQARARTHDSMQAFRKLTAVVGGCRRIVSDPPLLVPVSELLPDTDRIELESQVRDLLAAYAGTLAPDRRRLFEGYRFVDLARKVVGVGSVGTRCWVVLLSGRDEHDPLLLQVKEAPPSVLAGRVPHVSAGEWRSEGERVVCGQRLMQSAGDIFLGWQTVAGIDGRIRDFYVRQLRDWKGSAVVETMDPEAMRVYGALCGWTLARAHARTGDRLAIAGYLGGGDAFDRAMVEFSERYADLNERDYGRLRAAARSGRVAVREGL
ncbi:DUF2252 domain-containing protein [Pseudosporangium ferrugineum]|uniref:Uncharacterized protein (DUF2252 family) n=1 Tax=Pseudosporangium ferrugineum TaxID=439699 RepID=A0A2T0SBP1_9ACTN|nr:DUF2252 domain-containing protein [Pseudosporangium ferrugineum]PRY30840.1 uncharacterized protein (DUF2252 family) [Pseudosporangium ferrugineum]